MTKTQTKINNLITATLTAPAAGSIIMLRSLSEREIIIQAAIASALAEGVGK